MTGGFDARQVEDSAREYLERHNISVYLEDAVCRLLDDRPEKPAKFLSEYFDSVLRGTNTLLREYEYVKATPQNRLSFVDRFGEVLKGRNASYTATEYHHLVELICPDFPYDVIARAMDIAECRGKVSVTYDDNGLAKPKLPGSMFIPCLRICFSYLEFFELSHHALREGFAKAYSQTCNSELQAGCTAPEESGDEKEITKTVSETLSNAINKLQTDGLFIPPEPAIERAIRAACKHIHETPMSFPDVYQSFLTEILKAVEDPRTARSSY
ncbi:uncharacterized protein SPPG_01532 [Spizellomyces punctatus DAOM BR117]|uniref:Centriolar satellite-associated tubulin polyglutamylase complex regulator 1 n=1 Tax=Spizellomyces punctatus (strain DAOM BR117) TaxID=645134 RepID=A0A0L0HRW3_SPIPD|nr:uncharacterized protein SPPG_01532 [Spizellomyces punctatus DAOM BR117]KND04091.1 hypothetical protein SPPG_01532 [Spizellomyces punctatus DAOM BR117]|eukprot:XP_016612130.1 hypothetical protein SPPG_01532 [Spizellomyces punctatus DAOM BR117]